MTPSLYLVHLLFIKNRIKSD